MIEENARIVRVEGDYAWVETQRRSSCGGCSAAKGCGTSALATLFNSRPLQLRAHNQLGARVDDNVVIGLEDAALVRGSVVVYLLPLIALIAGAILARAAGGSDGVVALVGVAGLALAFWGVRLFGRRAAESPLYQAVVLRHSDTFHVASLSFPKK